jgi:hypothetical protein
MSKHNSINDELYLSRRLCLLRQSHILLRGFAGEDDRAMDQFNKLAIVLLNIGWDVEAGLARGISAHLPT